MKQWPREGDLRVKLLNWHLASVARTMGTQHCHEIIDTEEQVDTFTDNPPIQKYTVPDNALTEENVVPEKLSSTSSKSVNHIVQHQHQVDTNPTIKTHWSYHSLSGHCPLCLSVSFSAIYVKV